MNYRLISPSIRAGLIGSVAVIGLFGIYFTILTFLSGWRYTIDQFEQYWPYITTLVFGFGVQLSLFIYIRELVKLAHDSHCMAISGTTSVTAMLSCCTHYLVNLLPILGVTGLVSFVAQYQVELFWVGILSNFIGIFYMLTRLKKILKERFTL